MILHTRVARFLCVTNPLTFLEFSLPFLHPTSFLPPIPVLSLISRPAAFAVKAFLRGPVSSTKFSLEILAFKWIQPENNQTPLLFLPISPYGQIQQSHPISSRRQRSLISLPPTIPYLSVFWASTIGLFRYWSPSKVPGHKRPRRIPQESHTQYFMGE